MWYPLFSFLLHPECEQAPSQSSRQEQDQTPYLSHRGGLHPHADSQNETFLF